MKENKKSGKSGKSTNAPEYEHLDMRTADAASTTDFTGLIPANPRGEDDKEYKDILSFKNSDKAEG